MVMGSVVFGSLKFWSLVNIVSATAKMPLLLSLVRAQIASSKERVSFAAKFPKLLLSVKALPENMT